ncbi:MAG: helix-turn-helix transcriptional regulator [Lachnospiraceae bacterium]|nr:helix-turn-helix transcriptional regulator [Lachnospiraceae bacterium]
MTQERLAEKLGISPQSVSKWENNISMPDIALLPNIAGIFGVSVDELFGLNESEKLRRIENRLEFEEALSGDVFWEYEDYLTNALEKTEDKAKIYSLLAHLYHHRMASDAKKVSQYARASVRLAPEKKDCQWLLDKAEGAVAWDWNAGNHAKVISFYQEIIAADKKANPDNPTYQPHFWLIDNLIADHRTKEAREVLADFSALQKNRDFMIPIYEANITLAEYDEKTAEEILAGAFDAHGENPGFLFEAAQYYAKKGAYDRAVELYEASYEKDEKPRFADALQGIVTIYEIQGRYQEAANICDRYLENLREEWNLTEVAMVKEIEREKARLLEKVRG